MRSQHDDIVATVGMHHHLPCTMPNSHRCDNLFQQLESRTLTAEEEAVIQQRVAFQRKMFEEYEKREQKRKVRDLL